MLAVVFTLGSLIGLAILIWLNTKSGKRWKDTL